MNLKTTKVFARSQKAYNDGKRLIINEGGTSAGKTWSVLQLLILIAGKSNKPLIISIVSESLPHLKKGCIRNFKEILGEDFDSNAWSITESIYKLHNSTIEFFSADQSAKLRGGRRDILFINEANNVSKDAFDELDVRTRKCTFIDFNPVEEFYAHALQHEPFVEWIHSTYLDAVNVLDPSVVANILSRKTRDPNWWHVYGLGLVGKIEGLIHPNFNQCKTLPENGKVIYGLDFGFSNDPCALVKSVIQDDCVFSRELLYEKGLTNDQLAKRFECFGIRKGYDTIIADCAEPKSIEEIHLYGYDIRPCVKGADSITYGIQRVNQYRQYWTEDSLNAIKEQRNYRYEKDKDGKFTDKPISDFSHIMDARRYSLMAVHAPEMNKAIPELDVSGTPDSNVRQFNLTWNKHLISRSSCRHYGAMSLTDKGSLYINAAMWDEVSACLCVYWEACTDNPMPEAVVKAMAEAMHMNEFYFDKLIGNNYLVSTDQMGPQKVYNDLFKRMCAGQTIKIKPASKYDSYGSISLLNDMVPKRRLIIHSGCTQTAAALSGWRLEKGITKDTTGFIENVLMMLSELKSNTDVRAKINIQGYKHLYNESPSRVK